MSHETTAAELLALLTREREALCAARLEEVTSLGPQKEDAIARLRALAPDAATLAPLRRAARRNAGLLAAALEGLREGAARLDTARTTAAGFDAYDRNGRTDRIAASDTGTLERRA